DTARGRSGDARGEGAGGELKRSESRRSDSNRRNLLYKSSALPAELLRRDVNRTVRSVVYLDDMEHPKVVGDKTTLAVMAALYEAGYGLYTPFGENTRVDLIVERS